MWPRPWRACGRSASMCRRASSSRRASKTVGGCTRYSRHCMKSVITRRDPDARGYFGEFGGRFVPETLVEPVEQLERAYFEARDAPAFHAELDRLLKHYVGRPTPTYETTRLAQSAGGARIFLK